MERLAWQAGAKDSPLLGNMGSTQKRPPPRENEKEDVDWEMACAPEVADARVMPYFFMLAAGSGSNERKWLLSAGTQRSSTIPDQPATCAASFGIRPQTFVLECHGRV